MTEKPTIAYKDKTGYHTLYTICYITKESTMDLSKTSHGSEDGYVTICGKEVIDGKWYINNNTFDGIINCKECIRILEGKIK